MKAAEPTDFPGQPWQDAYRMRWKRRRLLWRAFRSRRALRVVKNRTESLTSDSILAVSVVRNEMLRLPYFLKHYRALGVTQFLMIDNGSDDGTAAYLADQQDVSLWHTAESYRASRFGLDWTNWLLRKYGSGRWCLTVDADELLVYSQMDHCALADLTKWLEQHGRQGFGALMLDLYPNGPLGAQAYSSDQDPLAVLKGFDAEPYRAVRQWPLGNLWVQGGARERMFFQPNRKRSPTLNKLPLIKWHRRFAYVNSTHAMLPPRMNFLYDGPGGDQPSGALLHTKFLPEIVSKSETEKQRGEHFGRPEDFGPYYDAIKQAPNLWHNDTKRYAGPDQLSSLGLIADQGWGVSKHGR